MASRGFDVAPIDDHPLRRYALRTELESAPADAAAASLAHPIDVTHMVTVDLGLADTLELLADRNFLYVMEGGRVTGIITLADLQRAPVGMVVLWLILAAEIGMNELIRHRYGETAWLDHLTPGRRDKLQQRFEELRKRDLEASMLETLTLEDRLELIERTAELRAAVGFGSRRSFGTWRRRLTCARNDLAHGHTLLDRGRDATEALALVFQIRDFAQRVWELVEARPDARSVDRAG